MTSKEFLRLYFEIKASKETRGKTRKRANIIILLIVILIRVIIIKIKYYSLA